MGQLQRKVRFEFLEMDVLDTVHGYVVKGEGNLASEGGYLNTKLPLQHIVFTLSVHEF